MGAAIRKRSNENNGVQRPLNGVKRSLTNRTSPAPAPAPAPLLQQPTPDIYAIPILLEGE